MLRGVHSSPELPGRQPGWPVPQGPPHTGFAGISEEAALSGSAPSPALPGHHPRSSKPGPPARGRLPPFGHLAGPQSSPCPPDGWKLSTAKGLRRELPLPPWAALEEAARAGSQKGPELEGQAGAECGDSGGNGAKPWGAEGPGFLVLQERGWRRGQGPRPCPGRHQVQRGHTSHTSPRASRNGRAAGGPQGCVVQGSTTAVS